MSDPGPLLQSGAADADATLWHKAPAWRNLTVAASLLTLAAVATPLLLQQQTAPPSHVAMAPTQNGTSTPQSPAPPQATPPAPHPAPAIDLASLPAGTEIVVSGEAGRVGRHNRYAPSLGGDLPIAITILTAPKHGTLSTAQGTASLHFPNAGITRMSAVTDIYYQSRSGYSGADSFSYRRTSTDPNDPLNARVFTVHIYVTPHASTSTGTSSGTPSSEAPHPALTPLPAPRTASLAQPNAGGTATACGLAMASVPHAQSPGTVIAFVNPTQGAVLLQQTEQARGALIDPAWQANPRVILRGDNGQTGRFTVPAGLHVAIGDRVTVQSPYRNMALPCNFVPALLTADLGAAPQAQPAPPPPPPVNAGSETVIINDNEGRAPTP